MPSRSAAVYSGRTSMPSGVSHVEAGVLRAVRPPGRTPSAAGWSRSRGCSWHLQEVEELGQRGPDVDTDVHGPLDAGLGLAGDVHGAAPRPPPARRRRRRRGRRRRRRWSTGRRRWRRTCGRRRRSRAGSSVGGPAMVATPPTSNTLRANDRRGVNVAAVPMVARKIVGRARPPATEASTRRRRASNPADQRLGASPLSPAGGGSRMLGNSVSPVSGALPGVDVALPGDAGGLQPLGHEPGRRPPPAARRRPPAPGTSARRRRPARR